MKILSNNLFVNDPNSRRINVFTIPENLPEVPQYSHSIPVIDESFKGIAEENSMSPGLYTIRNDGLFIFSSRSSIFMYRENPQFKGVVRYFLVNPENVSSADLIFKMDMPGHIVTEWFTIPPPFYARGLMALSTDDRIFSVWTSDILFKVHSADGVYERSFYHPYTNRTLNHEDATNSMDDHDQLHEAVRNMRLPETWPAINRMFIDDEDRIWAAAIADDPEIHEWWVMSDTGELLARFNWPRDQSIVLVKDNNLYTRETEEETALQQTVRYSIKLTEM